MTFRWTSAGAEIDKDPDARLDYTVDMSAWLEADTITTHVAEVISGDVVLDESAVNDGPVQVSEPQGGTRTIPSRQSVVVWLSGGTPFSRAAVRIRIVTLAGRERDVTFGVSLVEA